MTEQTLTPNQSGTDDKLMHRLSWAAAGLGILIALVSFAAGRSLWLDEAMITLNLRELSWAEITKKLYFEQMAPVGWILLEKALWEATGNLEYGLRIPSFLAWVGSVLLFRDLSWRQFAPLPAVLATVAFCLCAPLLKFAVEIKHYEVDVLVATAALWSGLRILSAEKPPVVGWVAFASTAILATLFTFGGIFAVAATGLALMLHFGLKRDWSRFGMVVAIGVVALMIFAWLLLSLYRPMMSGSGLTQGGNDAFFTRTSFLPLPTSISNILWLPSWLLSFQEFVFYQDSRFVATLLIAIGLVVLAFKRREMLLLTAGPLAVGMLASMTHAYPMFQRLSVFALPGLLLALAFALSWIAARTPNFRLVPVGLLALAMFGSLLDTAFQIRQSPPYANHENKPVLTALKEQVKPEDRIYISNGFIPAWLVYRGQYGMADRTWYAGRTNRSTFECMIRDMPDLASVKTLWLVVIQLRDEINAEDLGDALSFQGLSGKHEAVASSSGVTLHRIDLSPRGSPAIPYPQRQCGQGGSGIDRTPTERFRDGTMIVTTPVG